MFAATKSSQLHKKDRSNKGYVDSHIKPLVNTINKHPEYYTTSSCAGRIVLATSAKKKEMRTLLCSHSPVSLKTLQNSLQKLPKEDIFLRQEGFILHVACRDLQAAEKLLNIAQHAGLKRSGIISMKRIIVEIRSTEHFETIIAELGHVLVDLNYLKVILSRAHENMKKNKEKNNYFRRSFIAKTAARTITTK